MACRCPLPQVCQQRVEPAEERDHDRIILNEAKGLSTRSREPERNLAAVCCESHGVDMDYDKLTTTMTMH